MQVNETQESCFKSSAIAERLSVMKVLPGPLAEVAAWQEIKLNTDSDYEYSN